MPLEPKKNMTPLETILNKLLKIHYEPEHESGQTCWCQPKTLVKDGVPHIEHNEQRVILKKLISSAYLQGKKDEADRILLSIKREKSFQYEAHTILSGLVAELTFINTMR